MTAGQIEKRAEPPSRLDDTSDLHRCDRSEYSRSSNFHLPSQARKVCSHTPECSSESLPKGLLLTLDQSDVNATMRRKINNQGKQLVMDNSPHYNRTRNLISDL